MIMADMLQSVYDCDVPPVGLLVLSDNARMSCCVPFVGYAVKCYEGARGLQAAIAGGSCTPCCCHSA